jgi:23S rRNA (cytosine1962-C5)-methyltransferase
MFIRNIFAQNACEFVFEKRLENVETFKTLDENRSLKNLVFRKTLKVL